MVNTNRLPMPLMESYEWQYEGLCRTVDPDAFFSPEAERGSSKQRREQAAKAMCAACPVIERCREHALSVQEPYGVWGGLSEAERTEILAGRRAARRVVA
ncbi:MAG: WhiB family transcriptional regulator [Aeromicrobium erythreum]